MVLDAQKNYEKAFSYFTMSTQQGFVESCNFLGLCYEYGKGTEKNIFLAKQFYSQGASTSLSAKKTLTD